MSAPARAQGTTQPERSSPVASARQLPIDGLPREALLAFTAQMAALIRYAAATPAALAGAADPDDASFAPFFEHDLEVQLALIATFRPATAEAALRGAAARFADDTADGEPMPEERARLAVALRLALAPLNGWWVRLQGPPGVLGGAAQEQQLALLAPFAQTLRGLVQQGVVPPLQDVLSASPELFEITRGLDPALWGPVAQSPWVGVEDAPAGVSLAALVVRLAAALAAAEGALVAEARTWLATATVQGAARPPHQALLCAFLELLEVPRRRMNTFARAHLGYYYETVLGQRPRGAVADRAFVVLRPAPPATATAPFPPVFLPRGTALAAGKEPSGQDRTYQLLSDVQVDLVTVARLLSLATRTGAATRSGEALLATDSAAGGPASAVDAEVGFALSSAVLALAGGTRRIRVTLELLGLRPDDDDDDDDGGRDHRGDDDHGDGRGDDDARARRGHDAAAAPPPIAFFNVKVTGPDGWVALDEQAVLAGDTLALDVIVPATQPAIVGYRAAVHGPRFSAQTAPVMLFALDEAGSPTSARALTSIAWTSVRMTVDVDRVPALPLASPAGPLDPDKPFAPLGFTPLVGAALLVACPEALEKQLTKLTLHLSWQGLPAPPLYPDDFATYYAGYEMGLPGYVRPDGTSQVVVHSPITRTSFQVVVGYRSGGQWQALTSESQPLPLFDSLTETTFYFDGQKGLPLPPPCLAATAPFKWQPLPPEGILRLQLVAPSYGFGTSLYPLASAVLARWNVDYVIDQVKGTHGSAATPSKKAGASGPASPAASGAATAAGSSATTTQPASGVTPRPPLAALNPPLTPMASGVTLSYSAEAQLEARATDDITFYRVSPWLAEPVAVPAASRRLAPEPVPLLAEELRGYALFAGLRATTPGRSVACLVMLAQPGQLAASVGARAALTWWYRAAGGRWAPLRVEDRTGQLCRSGIVSFAVPDDAAAWPGMGEGLVWLRAEVSDLADYAVLPAVSGVLAQATECARVIAAAPASGAATTTTAPPSIPYDVPLPAGTIVGLRAPNPKIAGVAQPLPTHGGQRAEDEAAMYRRVAERLRHKDRAVTAWDFERLALQRYPSLFAARCLTGVAPAADGNPAPVDRGALALLVSPRVHDASALSAASYPPRVDDATLAQLQRDLAARAAAAVELWVGNPVYVPVTVAAKLTVRPGQDPSMIGPRLEARLRAFLSPWIFQASAATSLDCPASSAQVRRFLASQPEVQAIQALSCRVADAPAATAPETRGASAPARPWRILVSAWQHELLLTLSTR